MTKTEMTLLLVTVLQAAFLHVMFRRYVALADRFIADMKQDIAQYKKYLTAEAELLAAGKSLRNKV